MKICIVPNSATIAVLAAGVIAFWSAPASSAITIFSSTLSKIGEPVPTSSAKGAAIVMTCRTQLPCRSHLPE
jgi:hypothetical protein